MSAFVVTDKTINQFLFYLSNAGRESRYLISDLEKAIGMNLKNGRDFAELGQRMFALNCEAVNQRYGPDSAKDFRTLDYAYRVEMVMTPYQALARLKCWLYQCSEGNVPETPLYKAMEQVSYEMAMQIVTRTPQYDAAGWEAH
jgi:hypothetical protein